MVPHDVVPILRPILLQDGHISAQAAAAVSPWDLKYGSCGLGSVVRSVGSHGSNISYSHQCGRLILN